MWVTKQLYKQRNKHGDNWRLETLFMLFIQDWKLHAIINEANFSFSSLAESPPRDLQTTAHK